MFKQIGHIEASFDYIRMSAESWNTKAANRSTLSEKFIEVWLGHIFQVTATRQEITFPWVRKNLASCVLLLLTTDKHLANILSSSEEQVDITRKDKKMQIFAQRKTLQATHKHRFHVRKVSSTQLHIFISTMHNFNCSFFQIQL